MRWSIGAREGSSTLEGNFEFLVDNRHLTVPWWWYDALLFFLASMGLMAWLFGRKLVRPAITVFGMAVGATTAWSIVRINWPDTSSTVYVIAAAILSAVVFFMLWRIGIALVMAVATAVVAPWILMIVQGQTPPAILPHVEEAIRDVNEQYLDARIKPKKEEEGEQKEGDRDENKNGENRTKMKEDMVQIKNMVGAMDEGISKSLGALNSFIWGDGESKHDDQGGDGDGHRTEAEEDQGSAVGGAGLSSGEKWIMGSVCIGGAAVAFVIALLLPNLAASLVTSLLGVLMMSMGVNKLGDKVELLGDILPTTPRGGMYAILGLTIIGTLLQWTFCKGSTDK